MNRLTSQNPYFLIKSLSFGLSLIIVWLFSTPTSAQKISQTFFVNDWANVLTDIEKQTLEKKIKAYADSTSTQIAIVTLDSLQGVPIEQQALEIANDWGIGQKRKNNGILILVSIKDRKARVELGKGITKKISNAEARKIVQIMTRPYFRNKEYHKGLNIGIERLMWLLNGQFKNYKLGWVFYLAVLGLIIWLIGLRASSPPPLELGVAALGVMVMELYWMVNHISGWIPIITTIGWLVLLLMVWRVREYINDVKWYKINIEKRIGEVKSRQFHKKYVPTEVENKLQEFAQTMQQGNRKALKMAYHNLYKILNSPEKHFNLRPDLALLQLDQKLSRLAQNDGEEWGLQYINWLQTHLKTELDWSNSLTLEKLSDNDSRQLNHIIECYQTLFTLIEISQKQSFQGNINQPKFLQNDRQQTLNKLQAFCLKATQNTPKELDSNQTKPLIKHLQSAEKTPHQIWGYDYLSMLQQMAKLLGIKGAHKITDQGKLEDKLTNKSLAYVQKLSVWNGYPKSSQVVQKTQQAMYERYKKWNEAKGDDKLNQLLLFYNAYVERGIEEKMVSKSAYTSKHNKKTYTYPKTKNNSSQSSYDDYDDYSRGSGSSWGGGSFDGDGGSGDW